MEVVEEAALDGPVEMQQHPYDAERLARRVRHGRLLGQRCLGLPEVIELSAFGVVLLHEDVQVNLVVDDRGDLRARQGSAAAGEPPHRREVE